MRTLAKTVAAAALMVGSLTTAACGQTSQAGQISRDASTFAPTTTPAVQLLGCYNYFRNGCLPWHELRYANHHWGCYPC